MSSEDVTQLIEMVGLGIESLGVLVIVLGVVVALVAFGRLAARADSRDDAVEVSRRRMGAGILLGLEFLVAGDIVRTVAVEPSFTSVGVLAIVVLIRTFLSFTLELELTGRLPWQQDPHGGVAN